MRTILLTSAGMMVANEVKKAIGREPSQTHLAYITTASNKESNKTYLDLNRQQLREEGYKTFDLDIENKIEEEIRAELQNADAIFVSGGNTYFLLQQIHRSGFDQVVKQRIEEGIPYIGVSAGSIVLCPTIESAGWGITPDANDTNLTDLTGLALVPFLLHVHYEEGEREILQKVAATAAYPVRILTDHQAFLVQGDQIQLVGEQPEISI